MDFTVPVDQRGKIKENDLALVRKLIIAVGQNDDGDTNCSGGAWNDSLRIGIKTGGNGNQRKNLDHTDHSIDKIG